MASDYTFEDFLKELDQEQNQRKSEDQLEAERAKAIFEEINAKINKPPEPRS